ncbi:hypothetical protein ACOMHN_058312 [Nucella lapillus]
MANNAEGIDIDDDVMTGAAVTSFRVRVSSDAEVYSNWGTVTVFDSSCLTCAQQGNCTQLAQTCLINNKCYQDGNINTSDVSEVCDVSSISKQWTSKASTAQFAVIPPPLLSGPDSDFLLTCAFNTSAGASARPDARFRVTWFVNLSAIKRVVLSHDRNECILNMYDISPVLRHSAKIRCTVESFSAGRTDHSSALVSNIVSLH